MKQQGQQILEARNIDGKNLGSVWISGFHFARDCNKLRKNSIGAILSAIDLSFQYPDMQMKQMVLNIQDQTTQDIQPYFDQVFDFIEKSRQSTNVLVHCAGGISRSAALLISYMMRKLNISYDEALKLIQHKRKIVQPNQGFQKQLRRQERRLRAKNSMISNPQTQGALNLK